MQPVVPRPSVRGGTHPRRPRRPRLPQSVLGLTLAALLCGCRSASQVPAAPAPEPAGPARISAPLGFDRHAARPAEAAADRRTRASVERALTRLDGDPVSRQVRAWGAEAPAADLLTRLRRARVQGLSVEGEPSLTRVVAAVSRATDLPLVVAPAAERAVRDAGVEFRLELVHPATAVAVLNLLDEQAGPDVHWTVRHGVLLFTTRERAARNTVLRGHDLRGLSFGRTDFLAPRLDRLRLLDELEDDDGGGLFGAEGEVHGALDEDEVLTLVQELVAPGTWSDAGVSIEAANGFLFVRHTPEVQAQVRRLLQVLGA